MICGVFIKIVKCSDWIRLLLYMILVIVIKVLLC